MDLRFQLDMDPVDVMAVQEGVSCSEVVCFMRREVLGSLLHSSTKYRRHSEALLVRQTSLGA